jgi:hypothetical protein
MDVNCCFLLAVKSPSARPSIDEILAMPIVSSKAYLVPKQDSDDPFHALPGAGPAKLLDTIRFPKRMPGRRFTLDLPVCTAWLAVLPLRGRRLFRTRRVIVCVLVCDFRNRVTPPSERHCRLQKRTEDHLEA